MSAASAGEPGGASRPARPAPILPISVFVAVGGLAVWAVQGLDAKWDRLVDAPADMWTLLRLMFSNMSWSDLGTCLEAMWDSIAMAWLGTLFAAIFVLPLGIMAAENIVPRWFSFIVRQLFNILRAVPEIIIVLAVIPVLGLSKSSGVLALGIGSIGSLSKLCADTIEGIDAGPIEAVDAVGASQLQRVRWAVLPQSLPEIASFILYRFEINIRVSAILGAVGAGGIGDLVAQNLKYREWGVAGLGLIVMVVATIGVDFISGAVRRRLLAGPGGTGRRDLTAAQKGEALVDAMAGGVAG